MEGVSLLVFWVVTSCGLVGRYQRFGETYCLRFRAEVRLLGSGELRTRIGGIGQLESRNEEEEVVRPIGGEEKVGPLRAQKGGWNEDEVRQGQGMGRG
jgi:hypothetical protein